MRPYKPGKYASGQPITWKRLRPETVRTGEIWSNGPEASSLWVCPIEDCTAIVAIKIAGKDARSAQMPVELPEYGNWRTKITLIERIRAAGGLVAAEAVVKGYYQVTVRSWHLDENCPAAAGKDWDTCRLSWSSAWACLAHTATFVPLTYSDGREILVPTDDAVRHWCPTCVLTDEEASQVAW